MFDSHGEPRRDVRNRKKKHQPRVHLNVNRHRFVLALQSGSSPEKFSLPPVSSEGAQGDIISVGR